MLSLKTISSISEDLRGNKLRIGLTHGTFDLLHKGHISLLERASKMVDYLIVGIECDRNVRAYKTNNRPIFDDSTRLEMVTSTNFVDSGFIINEVMCSEMYRKLYKSLSPDYIFIANNFSFTDKISEDAKSANCELISLATIGVSTSDIIKRISQINNSGTSLSAEKLAPNSNINYPKIKI